MRQPHARTCKSTNIKQSCITLCDPSSWLILSSSVQDRNRAAHKRQKATPLVSSINRDVQAKIKQPVELSCIYSFYKTPSAQQKQHYCIQQVCPCHVLYNVVCVWHTIHNTADPRHGSEAPPTSKQLLQRIRLQQSVTGRTHARQHVLPVLLGRFTLCIALGDAIDCADDRFLRPKCGVAAVVGHVEEGTARHTSQMDKQGIVLYTMYFACAGRVNRMRVSGVSSVQCTSKYLTCTLALKLNGSSQGLYLRRAPLVMSDRRPPFLIAPTKGLQICCLSRLTRQSYGMNAMFSNGLAGWRA